MRSFATSPDRIKGIRCGSLLIALGVLRLLRLPGFAPLGTMFDNPIRQRPFKPDVVAGLLRLDPFVLQNLLALGLELAVKAGVFHQVVGRSVWSLAHSLMVELLSSSECNIGYPVDNRKLRTGRTTVQLGTTTSLLRPVCKISEDPTLSLSLNRTPSSRPFSPSGGEGAGGRLRGIATGSWLRFTSGFWRCSLPMNLTSVGTSRCDVPARASAGGIVAPLNAARTAQRAVPTRRRGSMREILFRGNLS